MARLGRRQPFAPRVRPPRIVGSPAVPTLDRWDPRVADVRRSVRTVAETQTVEPVLASWYTDVAIDRWSQPVSEPARITPRPVGEGWSADPARDAWYADVALDRWQTPVSEPVHSAKRPVETGFVERDPLLSGLEVVTSDKWEPRIADVTPLRPRVAEGLAELPPLSAWYTDAPLDRWQVQLSDPTRLRPRPVDVGLVARDVQLPGVEPITLDKWDARLSLPVRLSPRAVDEGWSVRDTLPRPTIPDVAARLEEPVRQAARPVAKGLSVSDPLPVPAALVPLPPSLELDPIGRHGALAEGWTVSDPLPVVAALVPHLEPLGREPLRLAAAVSEGWTVTDPVVPAAIVFVAPSAEIPASRRLPIDEGWVGYEPLSRPAVSPFLHRNLETPVWTLRPVAEGWIAVEPLARGVQIFAPLAEPVRAKVATHEGWTTEALRPSWYLDVTLDRWQIALSEPVRVPARPVAEGWSARDPQLVLPNQGVWEDVSVAVPTFAGEAMSQPALVDGAVDTPDLTDETLIS